MLLKKCYLVVMLILISYIKCLPQTITFTEHILESNFDNPTGIFISDFNNDGKNDVVSTSSTLNEISWWQNDGGIPVSWSKFIIDDNFNGAIYVFAEDIDGDSLTDVVAAAWDGNEVSWWKNNGGIPVHWTKQVIDSSLLQAHEVFACDLDKDNDTDVVAASAQDNSITWYRNDGGNPIVWTRQNISNSFLGARSVSVNDVDGDGFNDVIGAALLSHEVAWWHNDGSNLPVWTKNPISNSFLASHKISTVDFDNDSDIDILGAAFTSGQIAWWFNNGDNPVTWNKMIVDNNFPGAVIAYSDDLDLDGDFDVVGTAQGSNQIAWWGHDSIGQDIVWTKHALNSSFAGVWPMYIGDLDGDADIDIVSGGNAADQLRWWENSLYNLNFESFPLSGHFPLDVQFSDISNLSHPITSRAWDFDNDGIFDSFDQNPSWTYNMPGNFSVKLVVNYNSLSDTLIKENLIQVFDGESALLFNNEDSYVFCPASPSINVIDSVTFEAWIKPFGWGENITFGFGRIFDKQRLLMCLVDSHPVYNNNSVFIQLRHANGTTSKVFSPDSSVVLNEWQHIAFSYNSSTNLLILYINGNQQTISQSVAPSGPIADNITNNLFIGNDPNQNTTFDGILDEVRLWNIIRSDQEIQENLDNTLNGNETGIVGYWKMNEGFGDTLSDNSNNGNNGNIINCDWTNGTSFSPNQIIENKNYQIPDNFNIYQNYPNPFNSETTFKFNLSEPSNIHIIIYNIKGQIVKTLLSRHFNSGHFTVKWDGKDENEIDVSSGLYFYQIQVKDIHKTGKMLLIK